MNLGRLVVISIHSRFGYSATSDYEQCPYKYKLRWIDELEVLPSDDPANALILGTALHKGIETDVETAIQEYYMSYPVISNLHINESMKLEHWIPKVKALIQTDNPVQHEFVIKVGTFIGTIDLLEEVGEEPDGTKLFNIYDFKYANPKNFDKYEESRQLHIYKYMFEQMTGQKVVGMFYILVPKTAIRQKDGEDLFQFRRRLQQTLDDMTMVMKKIEFNQDKVEEYYDLKDTIRRAKQFPKNPSKLCDWCDYQKYCMEGENFMLLPKNERVEVGAKKKRKIWLYGAPFSGKTTVLDDAPDPLNLNTDGNVEFVTMQRIAIRDIVTVEGRMTKRKFAWEFFKEVIDELEKNQNDFKTIIIDLVDDTREMCRLYKYDQMGIQHESDSGYGKGWDIIKTEYLSTMRRFFNLDYENLVIVSHEVVSEIKKKNGQTITKISPNIQEAIANKLAGMVDIVARVVVEDDGTRTLNFKADEYVFGGGRLKGITTTSIPLSWDALMEVYDETGVKVKAEPKARQKARKASETPSEEPDEVEDEPVKEEPKARRGRKKAEPEPEEIEEDDEEDLPEEDEPEVQEAEEPKRRRKRAEPEEEEEEEVEEEPIKEEPKRRTRKARN